MPKNEPDGAYSVYNGLTDRTFELNSAAALITMMSDGSRTLDEVVEKFSEEFQIGIDQAKEVVEEFISSMEKSKQLVRRVSKVRKIEVPPPKYLVLELTNKCNLNCIHCSVCANERPGKELSTNEWKALITDLAEIRVEALGLSGGEPLLRRDFFEIAKHATKLGFLVGLVTNGLILDDTIVKKAKEMNLDVQVSIDGSNPTYHEKIRGCYGCFEPLLDRLALLRKHELEFTVAAVATALNYEDLPQLLELAEDVGAKSFRVQPFFPVGRGGRHRNELDLDPKMTKFVTSFLLEAAKNSKIEVGGFYFQFALEQNPQTLNQPCEDGSCSAGYDFAGVTHDGYVYPCSHIWQLSEDNIREKPISWIWENSRIFNFFRSLKREDVSQVCQRCPYFAKCRGGCKAMNILDGRFSKPDSHCWLIDEM